MGSQKAHPTYWVACKEGKKCWCSFDLAKLDWQYWYWYPCTCERTNNWWCWKAPLVQCNIYWRFGGSWTGLVDRSGSYNRQKVYVLLTCHTWKNRDVLKFRLLNNQNVFANLILTLPAHLAVIPLVLHFKRHNWNYRFCSMGQFIVFLHPWYNNLCP